MDEKVTECRASKCVIMTHFAQTVAEIWQFTAIFKMAAVCHFEFFMNSKFCALLECSCHFSSSCQLLKPLLRYSGLLTFQDGCRPPSWIGHMHV